MGHRPRRGRCPMDPHRAIFSACPLTRHFTSPLLRASLQPPGLGSGPWYLASARAWIQYLGPGSSPQYGESRTVKIMQSCLSISHLVDIRTPNAIRHAQHSAPTGTFVLTDMKNGGIRYKQILGSFYCCGSSVPFLFVEKLISKI